MASLSKPSPAKKKAKAEAPAVLHDDNIVEELIDDAGDPAIADAPSDSEPIHIRFSEADCGTRLDKALSMVLPQYSRSRIQQWIEEGHVTVDGATAKTRMTVLGDESVLIIPQAAPDERSFTPQDISLDIVYEDDAIIVINKPAGLVVHPGAGNWSGTLLNGLLHHCPALAGVPRAGIVHRLDKDTSGLMVVGKNLIAQTDLVRQLQARAVKRQYLAVVWGTPLLSGTIDTSMGRHPRDRIKMAVSESMAAKPAITHYERLAQGAIDGRSVSLVRCRLETGRTHQIRVHMQSIGFALVGDALYGKTHLTSAFGRQALQAWRLGLVHPITGEPCQWTVPPADDFLDLLQRAGIDSGEVLERINAE